MEKYLKGEVVVIPFPFSDLSGSKRRPALVIADLDGSDILLCQITSQNSKDKHAIPLILKDFVSGSLPIDSYIRPARIFTADKSIIVRKAGMVNVAITTKLTQSIIDIIA
ncbi:type II toxin-antitoxin system PemK/MazF family toxin [Dyadobacter chenwenxiniae]|uniref:Type II toxin-antitoxin system PemK/MazF family toxin n=1 Tax=Dyadobacter chenwenxiniae TaxID=2906456 RepID=A0A9X1PHB4_9BACT|nr:type II toxin-antitoxin system PemK/MazF family toxin [Dyadobacter chenwenxiniae]MCF0061247.1 type II toxin-antitoxin system PemK/MazF family toxin [Dyadobacter chenwenxiniae]UON81069.1 type II toxin-antitoxin system PemK/MazF family toxin [Dyadobacter chenwenxiniae]